jgi:hypothetical protein
MNSDTFASHLQYVERNGCCLNIEEKMRLAISVRELRNDVQAKEVSIMGKITGKFHQPSFPSFPSINSNVSPV